MKLGTGIVLFLSVWLTYTADRLFDVRKRRRKQLLSARHQYTKQHQKALWKYWYIALTVNLIVAFTQLSATQLRYGFYLLGLCLIYTLLNQQLSKYCFPKEAVVATIFAGAIMSLTVPPQDWLLLLHLSCLFSVNCLLIGQNERSIDAAMRVRSLSTYSRSSTSVVTACFIATIPSCFSHSPVLLLATVISLGLLFIIHSVRRHVSIERYRILLDSSLLLAPSAILTIWVY
ncbi:hypothetical protein [Coraliomargarita akajimensis]|uniref:hypothetical protein n=1 Tax=Coraliomargarita akajimensis TaxID=395922 RepID=UPI0011D0EAB9|nr:hypothetical protein [Coraliomargarita akajimensis]